jgi:hypothetical protein
MNQIQPNCVLNPICVICCDVMSQSKNYVVTECSHTFCLSCLIQSLKHNNKCPVCRTTIETKPVEKPVRQLNLELCVDTINDCFDNFHAQSHLDVIQNFNTPQASFKNTLILFGVQLSKQLISLQHSDPDDELFEYLSDGFLSDESDDDVEVEVEVASTTYTATIVNPTREVSNGNCGNYLQNFGL